MQLGILGVAIKLLEAGVLATDGLLWDLHVCWLFLCLGGTADADVGGSEGLLTVAILDVPIGVLGVDALTAHPYLFAGGFSLMTVDAPFLAAYLPLLLVRVRNL